MISCLHPRSTIGASFNRQVDGLTVPGLRGDAGVRPRRRCCGVLLGALLVSTGCQTQQPPQPVASHRAQPLLARVRHLPHAIAASQRSTSSPTQKDVDAILEGISRARASSHTMRTQSNPEP